MNALAFSLLASSVTRLGNLLDFGQVLKHVATNNLPKSPTVLGNFCKGVKIYPISSEIIFGHTAVVSEPTFT